MDKLLGIASFGVYCVYGLHAWTVAISVFFWVGYVIWLKYGPDVADR